MNPRTIHLPNYAFKMHNIGMRCRLVKSSAKVTLAIAGAAGLVALVGGLSLAEMDDRSWVPPDDPAIQYGDLPVDDVIARFAKQLETGKAKLEYSNEGTGYLRSLLKNLDINIDSQVLVFSKTSFQNPKIGPATPRAIFYNDRVAVGSVQNSDVIEIAALDPRQGVTFYSFDSKKGEKPRFDQRSDCLQCHQGLVTLGIPGIMVTSVYPSGDGTPAFRGAAMVSDHRTPFTQRWGGWYVTGLTGSERHMGNAMAHDPSHPRDLEMENTQNLLTLGHRFDSSRYLAKTSDVVSLMTLEHQTRMVDLMIRTAWDARVALLRGRGKLDAEGTAHVDGDVETLVKYMLFADELRLYEPVKGVSTFTQTFPQRGPRDKQGRSLRDFDLQTRMFKYPLSYMIYSETFDAMPEVVRERVYRRVYDVLSGADQSKAFERLSPADRQAILEIVLETKSGLPAYWTKSAETGSN
jgi:hypothetical protein